MTKNKIPSGIKNIIFDLGGVILDIDPEKTIREFRGKGMRDIVLPGNLYYGHEVFVKMEKGQLTEEQFRNGIREMLGRPVTDAWIDQAWCAMITGFPAENVELLERLRANYGLYLFSNTNSLHIRYFQKLFADKFGFPLSKLFVKDYYSSDIKLRKPEIESFLFVLNDAGIVAGETLFIDDLDANTEAAVTVGMHVITHKRGTKLTGLFY